MYVSEYAYRDDSVTRSESASANCRNYLASNIQTGLFPENFIHCSGTHLKLADSNFGEGLYQTNDYYTWSATETNGQLLFIFPTRVSLTTITLYYFRGLPKLRFYAAPDDFDIWDALSISYPHVDVASVSPGREPAGRRNISINVNFNTKKVLMYKNSMVELKVSEVEFFCNSCKLAVFVQWPINIPLYIAYTAVPTTTASIITTDSISPSTGM